MRFRGSDLAFALLVAAAAGIGVVAVLVWTGLLVADEPSGRPALKTPAKAATRPAKPTPPPPPPAKTIATKPRPQTVQVVISATRGDCWISAHRGTATGPVLLERVVNQGERVTLQASKIVLELGASGNVDVTVNGKPRTVPLGTASVTVG